MGRRHLQPGRIRLLAVSLAGLYVAVAHASSVTVTVDSAQGVPGKRVEAPVRVRDAQQLGAIQMEMVYDPAILEAQTVEQGSLSQETTVGANVIAPGRFRMVMNASARESISGDGMLMKAIFTVRGQTGQQTELRLERAQAWDNTRPDAVPYEMLVAVEPGKFTVGAAGAPVAMIAVIGGVVLLV